MFQRLFDAPPSKEISIQRANGWVNILFEIRVLELLSKPFVPHRSSSVQRLYPVFVGLHPLSTPTAVFCCWAALCLVVSFPFPLVAEDIQPNHVGTLTGETLAFRNLRRVAA